MYKGKKILVVVPARGGSKGVKLKNIRPVGGIPLVGLTGNVIEKLDYIDRAVVSTDHAEIARIAEESGIACPFMRPESLSGDRIGDWDVLHQALVEMEKQDNTTYDIIVMLQPTSPFRKAEHVHDTIEKLINGGFDAVWTVSETDSKGHPLKQFTVTDDALLYYDEKGKQIIARQQLTPVYHRNGVAYAITRECIENQKTIYGKKTSALIIDDFLVNIDTEMDFKLADFYIKEKNLDIRNL